MAIFSEAFLDKYRKPRKDDNKKYNESRNNTSNKNVGKTVYKPERKSTNNNIGDEITTSFKQAFMTAKEACALAIEDAFSIDYPESDSVKISRVKSKNLSKEYTIYKATIVKETSGNIKIKLESVESTGKIKDLAKKYGFSIEVDADASEREKIRKFEFSKVISMLRESVKEAKAKFPNLKIVIKDLRYYKENEMYSSDYEDFVSGERNTSYIQIASMDGATKEGQEAYDLVVDIIDKKVSDSSDLKGTIGTDGYKHDCIIYYESGI